MASTSTLTSPVAMTFEGAGGKLRFEATVNIPKNVKSIVTGIKSPLRAIAPAFAPETTTAPELPPGLTPKKLPFTDSGGPDAGYKAGGQNATRIGNATEFVPNAVVHSDNSSISTTSTSPALSAATTVKSSDLSTTPVSWTDERTLEDVVGRDTTNELMNRFDPTLARVPRGLLKTCPITSPRDRYLMHELIERVWSGRLIHETSRKDSCMYIWAPGSKVPKWLDQVHMTRQRNDRKKASDEKSAPNKVASPAEGKPAPVKPERPVNAVWTTFAQDENVRYGKVAAMSAAEYVAAERKKAEESGEKKADDEERKCMFKETFKQTGSETTNGMLGGPRKELSTELIHHAGDGTTTVVDKITTTEPKKATVPPHLRARTASPPHLRAKSADVEKKAEVNDADNKVEANEAEKKVETTETDTDTDEEKGVWVAARLPTPYSSD